MCKIKCNRLILTVFWIVSVIQEHTSEKLGTKLQHNFKRIKRQEDEPWSWGYVDYPETDVNARISTEPPTTTTEPNPCDIPLLTKPDFSGPGRRISEIKCYEYIWQIKFREDREQKNAACRAYNIKRYGVQFAIGGISAQPGEFPHMAGIGWKASIGTWVFKCGGSLISEKFILTAAHCTKASPRDTSIADIVPKIVRMGDKNIIDTWSKGTTPRDSNITRIIVHPQYQSPRKYFDIALMELAEEEEFNYILQPACLWNKFDTNSLGTEATLTGWGVIETAGRKTSPDLQKAVVDIIDFQTCDNLLRPSCNRNWCGVQEHQICAGKLAGGVDACDGDSGGPLQVRIPLPLSSQGAMHYVIGVTSFGIGCARANTPGVYTRVSSFIDWIEDIVWS